MYTAVGHTSTDINLGYTAVGYARLISLLAYPTVGYASTDINLAYPTVGYANSQIQSNPLIPISEISTFCLSRGYTLSPSSFRINYIRKLKVISI